MVGAFLSTLPAWLLFIIIVCIPTVLTYISFKFVWRLMDAPLDDMHNVVSGIIFSTVSVFYTVIVAFLIIAVWQTFRDADQAVSQEAAAIITVARDTAFLPQPQRDEIRTRLHEYTELVINDEWKIMRQETDRSTGSAQALNTLNNIWYLYSQLPPDKINATAIMSLDDLSNERVLRLMDSKDVLPDVFWFVLLLGGIITIGCCLILHMKNVRLHMTLTLLMVCLLTTSVWLIVVINNPFGGDLRVTPDALEYALHIIDTLPH